MAPKASRRAYLPAENQVQCPYCELAFSSLEELKAADLDHPIDIQDIDPSDFIDPDYFDDR